MSHSPVVRFLLRHKLAALLVLVVAVRLLAGLITPGALTWDETGPAQGAAYDIAAQSLLTAGRFDGDDPAASPVYSVALAGVYGWFGRGPLSVALWHTALAALTAYALYDLGRRLFREWGAGAAVAAGWLGGLCAALFPPLVAQTFRLTDGPLLLALLALGLMLPATLRDRRKVNVRTVMLGVMGGLVLGLGALLRFGLLPLLTLTVVWFLFRLPLLQTLQRVTPLVIVALLVAAAWPEGRGGAAANESFGQPLSLLFYGLWAVAALLGMAVSLRLWRDVSLLWFLPLLIGVQMALTPAAGLDPTPALPALFLFAGAAAVWAGSSVRARRMNQVSDDDE